MIYILAATAIFLVAWFVVAIIMDRNYKGD